MPYILDEFLVSDYEMGGGAKGIHYDSRYSSDRRDSITDNPVDGTVSRARSQTRSEVTSCEHRYAARLDVYVCPSTAGSSHWILARYNATALVG